MLYKTGSNPLARAPCTWILLMQFTTHPTTKFSYVALHWDEVCRTYTWRDLTLVILAGDFGDFTFDSTKDAYNFKDLSQVLPSWLIYVKSNV